MKVVVYQDKYQKTSCDVSIEAREYVFNRLKEFYEKHKAFSGESVFQRDDPSTESVDVLSEIADRLFDTEWKK